MPEGKYGYDHGPRMDGRHGSGIAHQQSLFPPSLIRMPYERGSENNLNYLGPKLMFAEHSLAGPKLVWAD